MLLRKQLPENIAPHFMVAKHDFIFCGSCFCEKYIYFEITNPSLVDDYHNIVIRVWSNQIWQGWDNAPSFVTSLWSCHIWLDRTLKVFVFIERYSCIVYTNPKLNPTSDWEMSHKNRLLAFRSATLDQHVQADPSNYDNRCNYDRKFLEVILVFVFCELYNS